VLLIALAAIIVLAAIGLAIFIPYQNTVTEQANATATASTKATSTVSANHATATATAFVPTATAHAIATATATVVNGNPDPYPPTGTLTLFDPLKTLSDKLPNSGNCSFSSGAYHITVSQKNYFQTCTSGSTFSNFAYQVDMQITSGDCGGIVFRVDGSSNKFYGFEVCQDGGYQVFNYQGNFTMLQSSTSSAVHTGLNQLNTLAVVANGQHMDLYINKQHITGVTDGSYSNGGFGLYAEEVNNSTDVAYNNLKIWTI
jgi:hypothetical protein